MANCAAGSGFITLHDPCRTCTHLRSHAVYYRLREAAGQVAVGESQGAISGIDGPQIRPGPGEYVHLAGDNPRPFIVETQRLLMAAGTSIAAPGSVGAACVIGTTTTIKRSPSRLVVRTTAHGRSFAASCRPRASSDRQR